MTKKSLLNNQSGPLIIQIYSFFNAFHTVVLNLNLFCYKTLHVSGIFSAHHQECSTVHSALVGFVQVYDDRLQAQSGWNCSTILILLGSGHHKPARNLPLPNVQ